MKRLLDVGRLFLLFLSAVAAQGQDYQVIDLGSGRATAINASGQVVGTSGTGQAFLYSGGITQYFALGSANGINSQGQVVGQFSGDVLYSAGIGKELDGMGSAYGINNSGQVIGWGYIGLIQYAVLYSGGSIYNFTGTSSLGYGINDSGQMVGEVYDGIGGAPHAFLYSLYSNGPLKDLGTLGGTYSGASAINAIGQVVGNAGTVGDVSHAFLYSNSSMKDLGVLKLGDASQADAINDYTQIVGESGNRAFLFSDGSMEDLNGLLNPSSDWTLEEATGINDNGQIVGYGINPLGQQDAFLLEPEEPEVPEPKILLSAGLLILALWRRKRTTLNGLS